MVTSEPCPSGYIYTKKTPSTNVFRQAALMRVCLLTLFAKGFSSVLQVLGSVLDSLNVLGSFLNFFGGIVDGFGSLVGGFFFGSGGSYFDVFYGSRFGYFGSGFYSSCAIGCRAIVSIFAFTIAASGETHCCKYSSYIKHLFHNRMCFLIVFSVLSVYHCLIRYMVTQIMCQTR